MLIEQGRPKATATDRSRVNSVHHIRFHNLLSARLSWEPSTLQRVNLGVNHSKATDIPPVHAAALCHDDSDSRPVEDIFRHVCGNVRLSVRDDRCILRFPSLTLWSL